MQNKTATSNALICQHNLIPLSKTNCFSANISFNSEIFCPTNSVFVFNNKTTNELNDAYAN